MLELSRGVDDSPSRCGHVLQVCVSPEAPEGPRAHTGAASGACWPSSLVWAAVRGLQSVGDGDVKTLSPGLGTARASGPRAGGLCGSSSVAWPGRAGVLARRVDRPGSPTADCPGPLHFAPGPGTDAVWEAVGNAEFFGSACDSKRNHRTGDKAPWGGGQGPGHMVPGPAARTCGSVLGRGLHAASLVHLAPPAHYPRAWAFEAKSQR